MADNFGLKIGLEGEKEFKKALTEINQSFKVLGSEMKLVESQFSKNDDSADALAARHKVLTEQVEAQRKKVEMLKQALANAAESFGENDRRTQAWQIQLNNAQAALNGMERELSDNEEAMDRLGKEMDDTGDSANDLEEELDDAGDAADDSEGKFSKLGGTLKTVGVAMGACVAAAAAADDQDIEGAAVLVGVQPQADVAGEELVLLLGEHGVDLPGRGPGGRAVFRALPHPALLRAQQREGHDVGAGTGQNGEETLVRPPHLQGILECRGQVGDQGRQSASRALAGFHRLGDEQRRPYHGDVKEQADKKPVCLGWLFQWRSPPGKRKKSGVRRS